MIEIEGLMKTYGRNPVLKDLSVKINEGERVYILAPNGYGKTTFLKILANVEPFQKGKVKIIDSYVPSYKSRRYISYVSEVDNIHPEFRIREFVDFLKHFYKFNDGRFEGFISLLNLDLSRKYSQFSKGERTLIRVALGLALDVPIYLIDEPLSSLDFVLREKVVKMLSEVENRTIIFTSHQIDELEPLADRFLFLKDGKFAVDTRDRGKIKDIYRELFA